jgi:hypothetical protein
LPTREPSVEPPALLSFSDRLPGKLVSEILTALWSNTFKFPIWGRIDFLCDDLIFQVEEFAGLVDMTSAAISSDRDDTGEDFRGLEEVTELGADDSSSSIVLSSPFFFLNLLLGEGDLDVEIQVFRAKVANDSGGFLALSGPDLTAGIDRGKGGTLCSGKSLRWGELFTARCIHDFGRETSDLVLPILGRSSWDVLLLDFSSSPGLWVEFVSFRDSDGSRLSDKPRSGSFSGAYDRLSITGRQV